MYRYFSFLWMRKLVIFCLLGLFCLPPTILKAGEEEDYYRRRRKRSTYFYSKYVRERENRVLDSVRLAYIADSLSKEVNNLDLQQRDFDLAKNSEQVKNTQLEQKIIRQDRNMWWILGTTGLSLACLGGLMLYHTKKRKANIPVIDPTKHDHLASVATKPLIILHIRLHQLGEAKNNYQFTHAVHTLRQGFDAISTEFQLKKMNSTQRHLTYIAEMNHENMQKMLAVIVKMQQFIAQASGKEVNHFVGTTGAIHSGETLLCGNEVWGAAIEVAENLSQQNDSDYIQITEPCLKLLPNDINIVQSGYVQYVFNGEEKAHKVYNVHV
jgi:hypothetical protein